MSKISIKTDFQDGDKLFAADLNNNFRVIQAGINANDQQLEAIIEDAIVRLDAELQAILDEQIWEWNGGDPVTFYKGTTDDLDDVAIKNGQLLYNTETGETALDSGNERITTGSGNVIAISETEPTNPATKLWINPNDPMCSLGTEVVDSMSNNQTNMAPSVHAVKNYVAGNCCVKEDIAKVSGTMTISNNDDASAQIILPSGFTFSNSRVISASYSIDPSTPNNNWEPLPGVLYVHDTANNKFIIDAFIGYSFGHGTSDDYISVYYEGLSSGMVGVDIAYEFVLMKIPTQTQGGE